MHFFGQFPFECRPKKRNAPWCTGILLGGNHRTVHSIVLLLILLGLCLIPGACGKPSAATYRPEGLPTDVAFIDGKPTWRGLAVGQATREEVIAALGQPELTRSCGDLEVWRYLPTGFARDPYDFELYFRLFLRKGVLQVISIQIWGVDYVELTAELGAPEKYIESTTQDDVAVYASRGITAAIYRSSMYSYVDYLQYYTPMSLEEYMSTWGQFHPEEMPWPSQVPERVETLGFTPGQTRRSDVEAALGLPDFEWADSRKGTELAYYHATGREPDDLHRFDFRNGVLVWMCVEIWQSDYTIESAIVRLGRVGVVARARFYDVIPRIQYYFWPERGIVLIARISEPSHPVEADAQFRHSDVSPSGSDVVIAHAQFEPIPLDLDKCAEIAQKIDQELCYVVPWN